MPKILKPFKSRLHRFAAGADLPDGADLAPHGLADLVDRGFIEGAAPVAAAKSNRFRAEPDPAPAAAESAD